MALNESTKIETLTALRFVAAMMIVFHHLQGSLGIGSFSVSLSQGVSFFFVLSGFILTTVYPTLESGRNIIFFYRKRFARIWPGYIAATILGFTLVNYPLNLSTLVPYLLMIQGWIPITDYFFSYNSPGWSISTEVFFYLLFPLILKNIEKNILIKLAISGLIVSIAISATTFLNVPTYASSLGKSGIINSAGILYIGPIVRIFEFIFGMMIAILHKKSRNSMSKNVATILEASSVLAVIGSLFICAALVQILKKSSTFFYLGSWISNSGSVCAFGFVVFIFAKQRGNLSKILRHPFFLILGEISYSLYLVHQILLVFFVKAFKGFPAQSITLMVSCYLLLVIFVAYLLWRFVETPGRSFLSGRKPSSV